MTRLRRPILAAMAAPLVLALAACGSGDDTADAALNGEPIAAIPAPDGSNWTLTAETTEMGGVLVGNPDAPLALVEYASHTCPACATFSETAMEPLQEYIATGVVSFEIRNQVHDALDLTIAVLSRCGGPATFQPLAKQAWAELNQIVATAQANGEALNLAMQVQDNTRFQQIGAASGLLEFFAARGISRDQAMQCLADPAVPTAIAERSQTQSSELGVTGTPTFFLNGRRLDGTSWQAVEQTLQQAGAR